MLASKNNWKDIEKYYSRTFVKFSEYPEEIFFIDRVTKDRVIAMDEKGEEFHILLENEYELEYILPQKTTFQYKDKAYILNRIPARQWKRGICKENTYLSALNTVGNLVPASLGFGHLKGFVNKAKYFDFLEISNTFEHGDVRDSYAITPRLCMSRNGLMFLDGVPVGHFNAPKRKMIVDALLEKEFKTILIHKNEVNDIEVKTV